jgi:hypothetical protein
MPIETIYAHKAGPSDWLAMVHIDDRSDLYRFYLGSPRFPTVPLARAWVTRKLRGTVPTDPDHVAWGQVEQHHWRPVSFWADEFCQIVDAEAEPVEDSGRHAYRTSDGRIVWDDDPEQPAEPPGEVTG